MLTHYQILKVAEDAPPEVIKAAYRALSQQHHPDSNPAEQQDEALRAMQAINTAYEALIEPEGRTAYDETLRQKRAALVPPVPGTTSGTGTETGLVPAASPPTGEFRRRRRSSSSSSRSRSRSHADGGELANFSPEPLFSSSSRSLTKTDRSMAPLFRSSQSTLVHGQRLGEASTELAAVNQGRGEGTRPGGGRGIRLVWVALFGLVLALLLLGGLVAWKMGLASRFQAWYMRHRQAAEGLPVGSENDILPMASLQPEKPYTRPAQTPQGRPWPSSSDYLPGLPILWNDGRCQITVDNTLHDSDVHVKLVARPDGGGESGSGTTIREAYIQRGTRMRFDSLRPGRYELRYRALLTGLIVHAATIELTQTLQSGDFGPAITGGSADGSAVMISLYKVAPGNSQRPILEEGTF